MCFVFVFINKLNYQWYFIILIATPNDSSHPIITHTLRLPEWGIVVISPGDMPLSHQLWHLFSWLGCSKSLSNRERSGIDSWILAGLLKSTSDIKDEKAKMPCGPHLGLCTRQHPFLQMTCISGVWAPYLLQQDWKLIFDCELSWVWSR